MWIIFTNDPFFKGKHMYYVGEGGFNFNKEKAKPFETWTETEKEMDYIEKNFELSTQAKKI